MKVQRLWGELAPLQREKAVSVLGSGACSQPNAAPDRLTGREKHLDSNRCLLPVGFVYCASSHRGKGQAELDGLQNWDVAMDVMATHANMAHASTQRWRVHGLVLQSYPGACPVSGAPQPKDPLPQQRSRQISSHSTSHWLMSSGRLLPSERAEGERL